MDLRAEEIYQQAQRTNKKIMILWSGGIDSTSLLVAMLKIVPATEQRQRLIVCLNSDSVVENLVFYKKFISNQLPVLNSKLVELDNNFLNQHIVLHGDPADALFGPSASKYVHLISKQTHLQPWKNHVDLLYQCFNAFPEIFHESTGRWLVDKIINNLEETQPEQVITIADWFWWLYVNFKWEGSLWRPFHSTLIRKNQNVAISEQHSRDYLDTVFFNAEYFQRWSYTNLQNLFPNGLASHKHEIKKYIFEFDKNACYQQNKRKTFSISVDLINGSTNDDSIRPVYYDQNWIGYTLLDAGVEEEILELLHNYKG
jgi:hypothetical protein